jgi:hypothetical protein
MAQIVNIAMLSVTNIHIDTLIVSCVIFGLTLKVLS